MKYWRIIREQRRPFRFLSSRILMKTGLSRLLLIRMEGFVLRFYPTALSAAFWIDPGDRRNDEVFFARYLRSRDVVVDVGANIGHLSLVASIKVGPMGNVVAVEAHPRIFAYLKGNLALNHVTNVQTLNTAVGDKAGYVRFSDRSWDDQNSVIHGGVGLTVPVCTLDDLVLKNCPISLLKVDVEGYEKFVLEGASQVLDRTECIYFESWERNSENFGYTFAELWRLMESHGFHIYRMLSKNRVERLTRDHRSRDCENLLATRDFHLLQQRTGLLVNDGELKSR